MKLNNPLILNSPIFIQRLMKHINSLLSVLCLSLISISSFGQAGILDTDFNGMGYFSHDFGNNDILQDVMIQPDQKIICTGLRLSPSYTGELIVMRLNSDGTLDTTFGDNGYFSFLIGQETYGVESAITADGKIIVAGIEYVQDYTADFMVLRLNTDGTLDTTFGTDGYTLVDIGGVDQITQALAVQPDGKILISGTSKDTETPNYNNAPTILRLNADGSLDETYGQNGFVQIATVFVDNELTTIKVQPDGKIIASGHFEQAFDGSSDFDVLLIRTDEDGNMDPDFGDNGIVIQAIDLGIDDSFGMDFDAAGNIYAAGFTSVAFTGALNMVLLKFLPDGTLDTSFGNNGFVQDATNEINYANDLLVQPDGKVLACGGYGSNFGGTQDFVFWRYLSNGTPDPDFGTNGRVLSDITGNTEDCNSIALQGDGKILAAGKGNFTNQSDFLVARYSNDIVSGLNELSIDNALSIYPNPVHPGSVIHLSFSTSVQSTSEIQIVDLSGRTVAKFQLSQLNKSAEDQVMLTVPTNITSGTYVLELRSGDYSANHLLRIN